MIIDQLIKTHVYAINVDSFAFYYGTKPDQNFEADELTYPAALMDGNVKSNDKIYQSGTINPFYKGLFVFFAYKCEMDATNEERDANRTKAWAAAKELELRLMNDKDNVKSISNTLREDVLNVFDVNLHGCALTFDMEVIDNDPICLT